MENLLTQIESGLEASLYYISLFAALTIPDICGAISSQDGESTRQKYADWFDEYVAEKYNGFLSGENCYRFRCSLLHQGSSQNPKNKYVRVLFIEPTATTGTFHNNIINDALNIDVRIFCSDIVRGARVWLEKAKDTELYKINYDKFMRRYPNGLKPYIVGVPVIG